MTRHRQIAAAILTGKADTAVRDDTTWRDASVPRTTADCRPFVGQRPKDGLATDGTCGACLAIAGVDDLGRLLPHAKQPPPYDQCPKCAEPYEQTYGIPAGYTNIVCDKCSGADADATRWALDDRWAPEWGGAAA